MEIIQDRFGKATSKDEEANRKKEEDEEDEGIRKLQDKSPPLSANAQAQPL